MNNQVCGYKYNHYTAGNLSFSAYLTSIIKNEYFFKNVSNRWHSGSEGQVQLDIKWLRNYVFKTSACDNNSVATYSKQVVNQRLYLVQLFLSSREELFKYVVMILIVSIDQMTHIYD